MATKSKSSSETPPATKIPISKTSPATPRVSKLSRGVAKSETDSPSPLQSTRASAERSPRPAVSKPTVDRRSPKTSILAEKPAPSPRGVQKASELQAQLTALQENLKKAEEKLTSVEKEKEKAINDLKEAQKLSEETNEKLREALVAQKSAEENIEIEKFRAVEMEQAGIESAQKKEEQWEKEIEAVKNQHAADVAALVAATQELEKVKQELTMTCDAKDQALTHADEATKIAETQMEKVETLTAEITRLKGLLNAKFESEADQTNKMMSELNLQIETLKSEATQSEKLVSELKSEIEMLKSESQETDKLVSELKSEVEHLKSEENELKSEIETLNLELRKAKVYKEKLGHIEASFEELNVELEAAKMSESYAKSVMEEWKKKVEELDLQVEEAKRSERSASSSLESTVKDLENNNRLLRDAETELSSLKEKVGLLEMSNVRQKGDLEESERALQKLKLEASETAKKAESLKNDLEVVKEEKIQALNNEKLAASSVQNLLEEKNKLIIELETSKDEEEKSKKALESLASALHEVSSEAREAKEKLLLNQSENENYEAQIEDLKHALQTTNEKYQNMLDDAKHEVDMLMNTIEKAKESHKSTESEWKEKETELIGCVEKSKEENDSLQKEISKLTNLLQETEKEAYDSNEERTHIKKLLKETESEVSYLKEVLGDAKGESMNLKESLMDKENELQSLDQEITELKAREVESLKKIEELTKLLEEKSAKPTVDENEDATDSEKDYDMLPKVVEFSEHNGDAKTEQPSKETPVIENKSKEFEFKVDSTAKDVNGEHKDSEEVEFKMWESCKIEEKDLSPERDETVRDESFDDDVDSKTEAGEGYDQVNGTENVENGASSPSKQDSHVKKKKPLLKKFGSLLKKKGTSNTTPK
ncbi:putative WEB family protein [Helianthus annuus]|uniref:WEB family protein n=1 Tax=Helianthus annuus TaxID=4232 RepID=A0A251RYL1_HELAN|nr:WEB family protein At3g02930, chloroplastic [Helianthus annuus]KAF5760031.1 putative WEB family protein [Helianthus annuus]